MNSWSRARKRIILSILILAAGVLVGVPAFFLFRSTPTCMDGAQNGDESGVDCGGSCQRLCRVESLPIITKGDPRVLLVATSTYEVAALLENANANAHILRARYTIKLYTTDSLAPVKTIPGEIYVPKGATFALFEPPFMVEGGAVPTRATLEWDQSSFVWEKDSSNLPELSLGEPVYSRLDSSPRLAVVVKNPTLESVKDVELTALLYDGSGTVIAASKTFIDSLAPGVETGDLYLAAAIYHSGGPDPDFPRDYSMMKGFLERIEFDWKLFIPALLISLAGLVTMDSFAGENYFFFRQSIWILVSVFVFIGASMADWRFLRRTSVLVPLFLVILALLGSLFILGVVTHGAQSWFSFGFAAFQPSDVAKLVLILILAKYFSRRHVEIKNLRHVLVSGVYAGILFILVFFQPDFGSAMVIAGIWLGMVLVSGISKKHLGYVALVGVTLSLILWFGVFESYQKARILTFLNPTADIHGTGYNAYQSTIAVGSGQIFGKGVGQGSQSKLQYLPEYETDFIFAAFAEEWGFVGTVILITLVLFLLFRIVNNASLAATNFETLFGLGVTILFTLHIAVHAGMNMGLVPVTGIVFPLMSYGGSHLVMEWLALGMISSMRRHSQGPRLA